MKVKRKVKTTPRSDPTHLKKSKIAPRSSLQFKIGPPFGKTVQVSPIYNQSTNQQVQPIIEARIDRGFDLINQEWIGYKRNYFSVVACFKFLQFDNSIFQRDQFYIVTSNHKHPVGKIMIRLISKCIEDDSEINLVQHTAKRDRGPIIEPPIFPVIPGKLPSHMIIKESANIRKVSKIKEFDQLFYLDYKELKFDQYRSILRNYPIGENFIKVAKYERIQFASNYNTNPPCGNKKSSVTEKKRFILQVQLLAELETPNTYAVIAISNTPPLTIRGRSPSSYGLFANLNSHEPPLTSLIKRNRQNVDNVPREINPIQSIDPSPELTIQEFINLNIKRDHDEFIVEENESEKNFQHEEIERSPSIVVESLDPKYYLKKTTFEQRDHTSFAGNFLSHYSNNNNYIDFDDNNQPVQCIEPCLLMKNFNTYLP